MCQGCETERRRQTVSRNFPVQISMWSQHLITVIPSEVEVKTRVAQLKVTMAGCLQPPRKLGPGRRLRSTGQTIREIWNGLVKYSAVLYWLIGIAITATAIAVSFHFDDSVREFMMQHQDPCDAQFHALRHPVRRLAVACGSRISFPWLGVAPGQRRVDADFPRHAVSHAVGGCGRNRDQRRRSTRAPVGAHRHTLGRAALQLEIRIPVVSIRTCWGVDRVLCRSIYRASARRPCVPSNPDSDRILADVPRRPLSLRRRLRSGLGNFLRACRGALPVAANRKSAIEKSKIEMAEGVRFELTIRQTPSLAAI